MLMCEVFMKFFKKNYKNKTEGSYIKHMEFSSSISEQRNSLQVCQEPRVGIILHSKFYNN